MTFVLRDLALALAAGLLLGLLLAGRGKDPAHRPIARILALVLEPVYYWLDLYSPSTDPAHRQPSHRKVTFMVTLAAVLGILGAAVAGDVGPDGQLSLNTVALAALVMAFALGPAAYNGFVTRVFGDKLGQVMTARTSSAHGAIPTPPGMVGEEEHRP